METKQNKNEVILELSFRLQMKDYKFRLATKRAWLLAIGYPNDHH